jgi:hypothetical protein
MLIKIIQLIHLAIIILIISSVFVPNYEFKKKSLAFLIFIFIHWITNYGRCGLTEIEYFIKGEEYKEGFIYRIVKSIITVPENYFKNCLYIIHIGWTLILTFQLVKSNYS